MTHYDDMRPEGPSGDPGDHLSTLLVHAGEPHPRIGGAVNVPIFQNTVFELPAEPEVSDIIYPRLSNVPNQRVLSSKPAALEGGAAATVFGSGMAAISTSLLTLLRAGDHLLVQEGVYGGTHAFLTDDLVEFGIGHTFVDGENPTARQAAPARVWHPGAEGGATRLRRILKSRGAVDLWCPERVW